MELSKIPLDDGYFPLVADVIEKVEKVMRPVEIRVARPKVDHPLVVESQIAGETEEESIGKVLNIDQSTFLISCLRLSISVDSYIDSLGALRRMNYTLAIW